MCIKLFSYCDESSFREELGFLLNSLRVHPAWQEILVAEGEVGLRSPSVGKQAETDE